MFKSKDFQTTGKQNQTGHERATDSALCYSVVQVDKYGRKGAATKKEDLKRFYHLEDEEDEEGDEEGSEGDEEEQEEDDEEVFVAPERQKKSKKKKKQEEEEEESEEEEEDTRNLSDMEGEELLARARGEVDMSSSDEESSEEEEEAEPEILEEVDQFGDDERTAVLGAFNMDWEQVDSTDILAVLQSFVPSDGAIHSVEVFATKEGAEQLELERVKGPQGLFEEDDEEDDVERLERLARGDEFEETGEEDLDQDALRRYQKKKMSYHVAIIRCDKLDTAISLYTQCDGIEFERSSNMLDLRYVAPTYMAKLCDAPRDEAKEVPADYEAPDFATAALQQTKVGLAWDMDDPKRTRMTMRDFGKGSYNDEDYKQYLASGSDEESDEEGEGPNLASLLGGGGEEEEEEEEEPGMEITWNVGLENAAKDIVKKVADKQEKAGSSNKEETVYEKYLRERGEKKRIKRKEERQKAKGKGTGEEEEDGEVDGEPSHGSVFNDPFFTSGGRQSKQSKKKDARLKEEEKEKEKQDAEDEDKRKAELELLVMDEQDDGRGYNLNDLVAEGEEGKTKKKKLSKRNKKRSKTTDEDLADAPVDSFEINTGDDRFGALGENTDFHIDPTATMYKKTKGMKTLQDAVVTKNTKKGSQKAKESRAPKQEKVSKVTAKKSSEAGADKSTDSLIAAVKRGADELDQRKKKKAKNSW